MTVLKSLLFISLIAPHSLNAFACRSSGGSCGGGGSVIQGVTLDTYLKKHEVKKAELEGSVKFELDALAKKLPEFAQELRRGFRDLDWYLVDVPLNKLPFDRTKTPFAIKQASIQIEENVFTNKKEFKALSKNERKKHIVHELVRRIFLVAEGTNAAVTEGSVAKATNLIMDADKYSVPELRHQLERIGFQTSKIENSKKQSSSRSLANYRDPVVVSVNLKAPISLNQARSATTACIGGKAPYSVNMDGTMLYETMKAVLGNPEDNRGIMAINRKIVGPWRNSQATEGMNEYLDSESAPAILPQLASVQMQIYGDVMTPTTTVSMPVATYNAKLQDGKIELELSSAWRIGLSGQKNPELKKVVLVPESAFPSIEFQGAPDEPVFTSLGLTDTERSVNEISILAERDWVEGSGKISLRNAASGVKTPHQIDGKEYVNCLKRNLEAELPKYLDAKEIFDRAVKGARDANDKKEIQINPDPKEVAKENSAD